MAVTQILILAWEDVEASETESLPKFHESEPENIQFVCLQSQLPAGPEPCNTVEPSNTIISGQNAMWIL